jgi:hypothetical protein
MESIYKDFYKLSLEATEIEFQNLDKNLSDSKNNSDGPPNFFSMMKD